MGKQVISLCGASPADPGGPGGPAPPRDVFKIMHFSGNFEKILGSGPPRVKTPLGPPYQNFGSAPSLFSLCKRYVRCLGLSRKHLSMR